MSSFSMYTSTTLTRCGPLRNKLDQSTSRQPYISIQGLLNTHRFCCSYNARSGRLASWISEPSQWKINLVEVPWNVLFPTKSGQNLLRPTVLGQTNTMNDIIVKEFHRMTKEGYNTLATSHKGYVCKTIDNAVYPLIRLLVTFIKS